MTGIRSLSLAAPLLVENWVCSTFESRRYCLSICCGVSGEIRQYPPRSVSSSAAKMEALSNLGQHSQSMEPCRETSAAARQSPMIP